MTLIQDIRLEEWRKSFMKMSVALSLFFMFLLLSSRRPTYLEVEGSGIHLNAPPVPTRSHPKA